MIYIIIPVFNRWKFTKACLESLKSQNFQDFKVIVVDHGSSDGTSSFILKEFPDVIVLNGDESMWWTAATNFGIQYALEHNADFILTLNNDTIAEPDYLRELFNAVQNAPKDSLIGSTAIDVQHKNVIYRGERLKWFSESTIYLTEIKQRPKDGLLKVTHFPGRGLLVPKRVFEKIGLFDEKHFPHYMADYDFTINAAKHGFDIYCSWDAKVAIYPEASSANILKVKKTIGGYKEHLFGIRGGGNLPLFYRYAFRNCPFYAIPSHVMLGTARRLLGYWL